LSTVSPASLRSRLSPRCSGSKGRLLACLAASVSNFDECLRENKPVKDNNLSSLISQRQCLPQDFFTSFLRRETDNINEISAIASAN
jgi:hypothetical protein